MKIPTLAGLGLVLASSAAFAQDTGGTLSLPSGDTTQQQTDPTQDNSNRTTRDNTDSSTQPARNDRQAAVKPPISFGSVDRDANGLISRIEAGSQTGLTDRFSQLDRNSDGNLSSEEFQGFASNVVGSSGTGTGDETRVGSGSTGASARTNPQAGTGGVSAKAGQASFGSLDVNSDGKLTQEEVKANTTLAGRFTSMDSDRNGSVSQKEFSAGGGISVAPPSSDGTSGSAVRRGESATRQGEEQDRARNSGDDTEGSDRTDKDDNLPTG